MIRAGRRGAVDASAAMAAVVGHGISGFKLHDSRSTQDPTTIEVWEKEELYVWTTSSIRGGRAEQSGTHLGRARAQRAGGVQKGAIGALGCKTPQLQRKPPELRLGGWCLRVPLEHCVCGTWSWMILLGILTSQ